MSYRWLTELSQLFLERDYLLKGQTVDERVDCICNAAEEILKKPNFAKRFKENFKKGWYSLSTPIWNNFGNKRGLPISCFGSYMADTSESIAYTWSETFMMTKHGGGTSATFGNLRPRGSPIRDNGESSGAVHFMQAFDNLINVVSQGKCYVEGTEVLTDSGFKDFRSVSKSDKLAQVDGYNKVSFTSNFDLVVEDFDGDLVCFRDNKCGVEIKVTPNHRMVVSQSQTENGKNYWSSKTDIVLAKDIKLNCNNRLVLSGWAGDGPGLSEIDKLRMAYQTCGTKDEPDHKIRFYLKEDGKIKRLVKIIEKIGYEYEIFPNPSGSVTIEFESDADVKKNTFDEWIELEKISGKWAEEFIEELSAWDATVADGGTVVYQSAIKSNVDLVQAIASLASKETRVFREEVPKTLYYVCVSEGSYISGDSVEVYNESYKGKVYCAVVPLGRLIVRYRGSVLVCGNTRRGNFAAYLPIDHADVMEFLALRTEGNPIQDLSYGVCVPDYWMEQMISGDVEKRKIWARVLESRSNSGFPYILFIDTVNRDTVDCYKDKGLRISHSNLCCVTGDQRVVSNRGMFTVKELYEQGGELTLFDGNTSVKASEMKLISDSEDIYRIKLSNGLVHKVTKCHKVKTNIGMVRADELKIGDKVAIQTNSGLFGHKSMEDEAFLLGLYQAGGTQHKDTIMLDIREPNFDLVNEVERRFANVFYKYGYDYYEIANQYGSTWEKFEKGHIPSWIWESDEATQWQYIKALFYASGVVNVTKGKDNPLRLSIANIDKQFLRELQVLLLNLGIRTSLSLVRNEEKPLLPNGKCYRLVCGGKDAALKFEEKTGFLSRKGIRLENMECGDNGEEFSKVVSIEYIGKQPVYCCQVDTDEHVWVCNGVVTSNSEIMLPDSEEESFVCDLSSMNILYFDEWKGTDAVELLVYLLDAVMTEFINKAKDIMFMERTVRFAEKHRALGVGWLGWHSYLQSKMIPWESMDAKFHNINVAKFVKEEAYKASAKLAVDYGEPEICKGYGRRNSTLLAIAPTKSSAFILGQASEGVEPHRANYYIKDLQKGKFTIKNKHFEKLLEEKNLNKDEIWEDILRHGGSVQHLEFLSDHEKNVFKTFAEISQKEIIIQAAQRQKYIDQGQSLNLMIHPSIPIKDVNSLIIDAWKMGVKSLYYQISINAAQNFSRNLLSCVNCES